MTRVAILLLAVTLSIAGCAGAGPSSSSAGVRPRCQSTGSDDQRPLLFFLCVESP